MVKGKNLSNNREIYRSTTACLTKAWQRMFDEAVKRAPNWHFLSFTTRSGAKFRFMWDNDFSTTLFFWNGGLVNWCLFSSKERGTVFDLIKRLPRLAQARRMVGHCFYQCTLDLSGHIQDKQVFFVFLKTLTNERLLNNKEVNRSGSFQSGE